MKKPETLTDWLTYAFIFLVIAFVFLYIATEIIPRLEDFSNTTI